MFYADSDRQIITKALNDLGYVRGLRGTLGTLVTNAYIKCLAYTHGEPEFNKSIWGRGLC
jgi:hypothetical protein